MILRKIIYMDSLTDELKMILDSQKPKEYELLYWGDLDAETRQQELSQADYLMATAFKIDEVLLNAAPKVKFIQKTGSGLDNIDLEAAGRKGIPVSNVHGGNAIGVAELTILLILALYRRLMYANAQTKQGKWLTWELRPQSFEMEGKTHGLIGMGKIGWETAKRSRALGTQIVYYEVNRLPQEAEEQIQAQFVELEKLLRVSDIISLHVPLLPETKGLISAKELESMKPNAILINVSRGGIVDEATLYEALVAGSIMGAGIDAWEQEPIIADNPLLSLDQVIATPHIGGGTKDTLMRVYKIGFDNIERVERGLEPLFMGNQPVKL